MTTLLPGTGVIDAKYRVRFREEKQILPWLQIILCVWLKAMKEVKIYDKITVFSCNRWKGRENDLTYFGNSSCHRSQPYNYTYSHLRHRHKLHCFGKDQGNNHRYLEIKITVEHDNFVTQNRGYQQNIWFIFGKKNKFYHGYRLFCVSG